VHVGVGRSGRGRVRRGIWVWLLTRRLRAWKTRATKGRGSVPRERKLGRLLLLSGVHRARNCEMAEFFFLLCARGSTTRGR